MKTNLKLFLNAALLFALIFFVIYLLIALAAYFGCCAGITHLFFNSIVWVLLGLGLVVFALCIYNNCYKKRHIV